MAGRYIKLFTDRRKYLDLLTDEQRGRMLTAMIDYAESGITPEYCGMQMVVWMVIAEMIDASNESYNSMVQGGKKGGRPKKQDASEKPKVFEKNPRLEEQEQEQEQEQEHNKRASATKSKTGFVRPDVQDVRQYCRQNGYGVDADAFVAHYDSNGWRVGRNPMQDWRAAVRTWARNEYGASKGKAVSQTQYHQRQYGKDTDPMDWMQMVTDEAVN